MAMKLLRIALGSFALSLASACTSYYSHDFRVESTTPGTSLDAVKIYDNVCAKFEEEAPALRLEEPRREAMFMIGGEIFSRLHSGQDSVTLILEGPDLLMIHLFRMTDHGADFAPDEIEAFRSSLENRMRAAVPDSPPFRLVPAGAP